MYERILSQKIDKKQGTGKAILLLGPRQVGKTTLIQNLLKDQKHLFLNADDPTIRQILTEPNTEQLKSIIGKHTVLFIDEAQRIKNIGLTLKLITDQFKKVQLYVSGSSSFELASETNETLTGRKWQFELLPISWKEYEMQHGYIKSEQQLENRLLYGFYPDVLNNTGNEKDVLRELVNSYLYKDILSYSDIRKPEVLEKLVLALALQIGNEVSYNELATIVGVDKNTISNYIDVLEKGYVVFKLSSFSRNLRTELKKSNKIYFYDVGVRNAIIGNFNSLNLRQDKGSLWENFLITERLKQNKYTNSFAKMFFWRTTRQQEIDFIEDENGTLSAYEFTWNKKNKTNLTKAFLAAYKKETIIIDRKNFRDFVIK